MKSERVDVRTDGGDRLAVWRSWGPGLDAAHVIVVAAGFGQRMRAVAPIASYLTANGAVVYRFDPLHHPGLSDGDVREFSLTALLHSLAATCQLARASHGMRELTLVGASLSARPVIRLAAEHSWLRRVVLVVGVVNVRATLQRVLGVDYYGVPLEDLPPTVAVERQVVDPRHMWSDRGQWHTYQATIDDLSRIRVPVVNFTSAADQWVEPGEVEEAFRVGADGPRHIVSLPRGSHKIASNPVALRALLRRLTAVCVCDDEMLPTAVAYEDAVDIVEPSFDELLELTVQERAWERSQRATMSDAEIRSC